MMRFLSLLLLGLCVVTYVVGAAVTVMHVLLFVLHGARMSGCEGDGNAGVRSG